MYFIGYFKQISSVQTANAEDFENKKLGKYRGQKIRLIVFDCAVEP